MTEPADLPAAVAALSGTVAAINTRLGVAEGRLGGAADQAAVEDLAGQFAELASEVAEALACSPKGPPAINWANLQGDERADVLGQLREWVTRVLLPYYPGCGLRPCWERHPQAVIELGNMWSSWLQVYRPKRPDIRLALEWHDRWMPNAMRRIDQITRECMARCSAE